MMQQLRLRVSLVIEIKLNVKVGTQDIRPILKKIQNVWDCLMSKLRGNKEYLTSFGKIETENVGN